MLENDRSPWLSLGEDIRSLLSEVSPDRTWQSFLTFTLEKRILALFTNKNVFSQIAYKFSSSFHRKDMFKVFNPFFIVSFFHCLRRFSCTYEKQLISDTFKILVCLNVLHCVFQLNTMWVCIYSLAFKIRPGLSGSWIWWFLHWLGVKKEFPAFCHRSANRFD